MKYCKIVRALLATWCVLALSGWSLHAQEKAAPGKAQAHVVITDTALRSDSELPRLRQDELKVKQGKTFLQVTQLIPAQGENAALQLMILIDDTLDTSSAGNNLNDIKEFIKAQPPSTAIAVGYMANATVNLLQNFTTDHELAVKAVRLPRGAFSTMDSPYLSLISVVKGWPQQNVRREVLMVSDGIDRLRGETPRPSQLGPSFGPVYTACPQSASMPLRPAKAANGTTSSSTRYIRQAWGVLDAAPGIYNLAFPDCPRSLRKQEANAIHSGPQPWSASNLT